MSGFGLNETKQTDLRRLWWRGGFPRSFLARSDATSRQWRADFIQTFLERDLRQFGVNVAPLTMRRFWMMVAHYHAQIWNASEIGRSLGEAHTTVKRHLDILCGAYVMRQLPPWFENLSKRQVKSAKVFVRDTGLLHELLGIADFAHLESNPKLGASWEGFALEQVLSTLGDRDAYFWHTQGGAELDLLNIVNGQRFGFEFKYADVPKITRSLTVAHQDLKLNHVFIVYPGRSTFAINQWATALSITELTPRLKEL